MGFPGAEDDQAASVGPCLDEEAVSDKERPVLQDASHRGIPRSPRKQRKRGHLPGAPRRVEPPPQRPSTGIPPHPQGKRSGPAREKLEPYHIRLQGDVLGPEAELPREFHPHPVLQDQDEVILPGSEHRPPRVQGGLHREALSEPTSKLQFPSIS